MSAYPGKDLYSMELIVQIRIEYWSILVNKTIDFCIILT